jgi:hypothetical protein
MCAQRDWRFDASQMRIKRIGRETAFCAYSEPCRPSPLRGAVWAIVILYAAANVLHGPRAAPAEVA